MKKTTLLINMLLAGIIVVMAGTGASAQFLKNLKNQVKETVQQTVEQRSMEKAGNATNTAIDKVSSVAGTGADKVLKGTEKGSNVEDQQPAEDAGTTVMPQQEDIGITGAVTSQPDYKSYDFVPGDRIIFEPDLRGEADAELPARFGIQKGNAEIQSYEGEKVLHLNAGAHVIVTPLMDSDNYLPEQFTLEFDLMYETSEDRFAFVNDFAVKFFKAGESNWDNYALYEFKMHSNSSSSLGDYRTSTGDWPAALAKSVQTKDRWHHLAIYVRKNIAKAYVNQYRVNASNTMATGAGKLAIVSDGSYGFKIKNLRLAAGGDDKYDKIVTDGKFITRGIQFDVAKATIKPESTGAIGEVVQLLKDHSDLRFEIQGHTDSDGDENANQELSLRRADAVKETLVRMGIDASRLSTKGFGESRPLDKNDTAEGKANNRRVEFVKM